MKKRYRLDVFEKLKKPKGVFLQDESNDVKIGDGWLDLVELSLQIIGDIKRSF